MLSGFLNCIKPAGATSNDVVSAVKRIVPGVKVGHLGTLDPGASGVLPVAVGRATKLFDFLVYKKKKYRAMFRFGVTTDTLDSYGKITEKGRSVNSREIEEALGKFQGKIVQIPPKYSACSINGVKAYKLARNEVEFEIKPKEVEIYSFRLIEERGEDFVFDIECSGGTYIRSLVRDLSAGMESVGYMSALIRLEAGPFTIEGARTLTDIHNDFQSCLLPVEFPLRGTERIDLTGKEAVRIKNGLPVKAEGKGVFRVYADGELIGIGENISGILSIRYYLAV